LGANYYLELNMCPTCGRPPERKHIGKSSAGWAFSLHVGDGIDSLEDWERLFRVPGNVITNEYRYGLTTEEMLQVITQRTNLRGGIELHRHQIDDSKCIGHGPGTWDLLIGEFS
jgi:hypothetical protein